MFLAVDIGNTQTSFGILDSHLDILYHWRLDTKASRSSDEFAAFLFPLLSHFKLEPKWDAVILCSVVPPLEPAFESFCQNYFNQRPFKITPDIKLPFGVNLKTPDELGADRIANAAYASAKFPKPSIVIDIGTATTFDVLSQENVYEGGIIFPGVRLSFEALGSKTAKLPVLDPKFSEHVIGKSTEECIRSGILYGYCDFLDGMIDRIQKELGTPCFLAMTGGGSNIFKGHLKHVVEFYPDLTLQGSLLLYLGR